MKQTATYQPAGFDSRAFAIECHMHEYGMTTTEARQAVLINEMLHAVGKRACATTGHKMVDHGWGNAESGVIDLVCTRCGKSSYTRLY